MDLSELTALIHAADRRIKGEGVAVTLTTINLPDHTRGSMYGHVSYGRGPSRTVFHTEEELRYILGKIGA